MQIETRLSFYMEVEKKKWTRATNMKDMISWEESSKTCCTNVTSIICQIQPHHEMQILERNLRKG